MSRAFELRGCPVNDGLKRFAACAAILLALLTTACGKPKLDFEEAKPYAVAWAMDNCKQYRCDSHASQYGAMVDAYEREDGWVFVYQLEPEKVGDDPEQIHLLVPHKNPRERVILKEYGRPQ